MNYYLGPHCHCGVCDCDIFCPAHTNWPALCIYFIHIYYSSQHDCDRYITSSSFIILQDAIFVVLFMILIFISLVIYYGGYYLSPECGLLVLFFFLHTCASFLVSFWPSGLAHNHFVHALSSVRC